MSTSTAIEKQKDNVPPTIPAKPDMRGIMAYPQIELFYDLLMDRLHMAVGLFLTEKFMLIINALPRNHEVGTRIEVPRFEGVELGYVGVQRQRILLEGDKASRVTGLDGNWDWLKNSIFELDQKQAVVSTKNYERFRAGAYRLEDILEVGMGRLSKYFEGILKPDENVQLTEAQKNEYPILDHHFDITQYRHLSLPLIQFAEFDGIVHIIYHENDHKQFVKITNLGKEELRKDTVGIMIKLFSREYEGLILDWDIVEGEKYKEQSLQDALAERLYLAHTKASGRKFNPILEELKYREYYQLHQLYFSDRFGLNKNIPETIRRQYHQIAILSILIDSYAHNISAHSLTALEWWFKQRAELLEKRERAEEIFDGDFADIPLITSGQPLDNEIHPLLRFLLDKGAFWTGLTRAHNFGGKISSLYSVLWHDFVNNPLYLGTIAFSEEILKLNINVTFLKRIKEEEGVRFEKKVELDGKFVSIDLSRLVVPVLPVEDMKKSKFIIPGKKFGAISERLKACKAFFPGGVVGRHAFFTILENEIRNVKHFPPEELRQMKRHGLTLNISIEEDNYDDSDKATYYKIGVWIKNPVQLDQELFLRRLTNLWEDIITKETNRPKLGGIYQDKVCAAMLFNNSFASVQDKAGHRGKRYYPWVKVGSSPNLKYKEGAVIEEIELTARRYFLPEFQKSKELFDSIYEPHSGYYKKFIHLWRGENIYSPDNLNNLSGEWENLSRFRFVHLPKDASKAFNQCREAGVIRIIHENAGDSETAYRFWLNQWMAGKTPENQAYFKFNVRPVEKNQFQLSALLEWTEEGARFYSSRKHKKVLNEKSNHRPLERINLIHGSEKNAPKSKNKDICRFRSHGILQQYFCGRKKIREAEMSPALAAELFETLATRICIFDNRLANRMEQANKEVVKEQLHCEIYPEDVEQWQSIRQGGFSRFHFLVVHLSFIEAFRDKDGKKKYSEDDIGAFIQDQVLQGKKAADNFILVVTTGRGRTQWWSKLKDQDEKNETAGKAPLAGLPYGAFVTFRPVESLIAAVENSIGKKDDVELKYRLTKILFGS
ncbi:MAG: hypothetical protein J5I98_25205 [Phaeodactylibacter sp.]|nr:hypothetical protein [Phaeodactylibacter sp.]